MPLEVVADEVAGASSFVERPTTAIVRARGGRAGWSADPGSARGRSCASPRSRLDRRGDGAKPCSRSQIRSSTDSVPTDSRIVPGPTPGRLELGVAQLAVRRAGGMDDQALRVADVGEVGPERHAADQVLPAVSPAGAVEREHRARAAGQVLLDERPVPAFRQAGVGHVRQPARARRGTPRPPARSRRAAPSAATASRAPAGRGTH